MNFTCNTKPLIEGLSLGIINSNISKFYRKSCLAQISSDSSDTLTINLEAAYICSEIRLKGHKEGEGEISTVFVDSLLLKQLVSTFETSTTTFEFTEDGIVLHSGKSKFTLPKMVDDVEIELNRPSVPNTNYELKEVNKADWKFIKDHQMYAIAMSFANPIYTKVWAGENGDVLVGDFNNGLYTHSSNKLLSDTCLLSDTVINLFNSLPEGAKLRRTDNGYLIQVETDAYVYRSEFTPEREGENDIGNYHSEDILAMMNTDETDSIRFNVSAVQKFLNQASIISKASDEIIRFKVSDNSILSLYDADKFEDRSIDCSFEVDGNCSFTYDLKFKSSILKSVISNFTDDIISLRPMVAEAENGEEEVVGIVAWDSQMTVVLAGVD